MANERPLINQISRRKLLQVLGVGIPAAFLAAACAAPAPPQAPPPPTATPLPPGALAIATATSIPQEKLTTYEEPQTPDQVAAERGGQAKYWKKVDWAVRTTVLNDKGGPMSLKTEESEWIYDLVHGGKMSELKPHAQIPQTREAAAKWVNGNTPVSKDWLPVRPQDVQLFVVEAPGAKHYADWMEQWLKYVPVGTVIGFELIQNHGTDIVPYKINVQPGVMVECYDDRQSFPVKDDVAAVIWNGGIKQIPLIMSGGSFWPWGNPKKVELEQHQYQDGQNVDSTHYSHNGKRVYLPNTAANFSNSDSVHRMVTVDDDGRIVVGNLNKPLK